jgi:hypothetical protein
VVEFFVSRIQTRRLDVGMGMECLRFGCPPIGWEEVAADREELQQYGVEFGVSQIQTLCLEMVVVVGMECLGLGCPPIGWEEVAADWEELQQYGVEFGVSQIQSL